MLGKIVSHYRVLARIGEGASGVVYKAEDLALGRGVALKFVSPDHFWDATARVRFQHEARMASSLNHPNICTIHEIGEHDGSAFIAMELLEGVTLSQAIAGEPMAVIDLLTIAIQICDGLDAAHTEGVIHRDVKSVNLFVTTRNQVKILDFALAQFNPARSPAESPGPNAWESSVSGTVPYMSPEQINRTAVDARTDLFSLGIVLFEMATGRRAFNGQNVREIQRAILREATPEPRQLNQAVPPELNRIIVKALEKQRELRYQTASDLRADLRRLKRDLEAQGEPRPKAPPPPSSAVGKRDSNWELGKYAGGLLLAAGFVLFGAVTIRYGREQTAPQSAGQVLSNPAPLLTPPRQPVTPSAAPSLAQPITAGSEPVSQGVPDPARGPGSAAEDLRVAKTMIGSGLSDQAAAKLSALVADHPAHYEAIDGYFLMAAIQEKQNRPNDAMATYLEVSERFAGNARAADALYRLANLTLRSNRPQKEIEARKTLEAVIRQYAKTPSAALALLTEGELDEAGNPSAAISHYSRIARDYPRSDVHAEALTRLAALYEKQKLYGPEAATLVQLATSHREHADEAWYRAGEIYERRLNNPATAREAYMRVSAGSKYFAEAQKELRK